MWTIKKHAFAVFTRPVMCCISGSTLLAALLSPSSGCSYFSFIKKKDNYIILFCLFNNKKKTEHWLRLLKHVINYLLLVVWLDCNFSMLFQIWLYFCRAHYVCTCIWLIHTQKEAVFLLLDIKCDLRPFSFLFCWRMPRGARLHFHATHCARSTPVCSTVATPAGWR